MVKRDLVPLLLTAALLAPAAIAGAAQVEPEPKREFDLAVRYFQAEEYDAALPHFERAYELSGRRPATIFALAQCERALKRYSQAILHFREYLATGPDARSTAEVEETLALLTELEQRAQAEERAKQSAEAERRRAEEAERRALEERQAAAAQREADLRAREQGEEARRREAEQRVQAPPPALLAQRPPPPEEDDGLLASPWFWVVAGAVVAGGAVATGVALGAGAGEPYAGSSGVILEQGGAR